MERRAGDNPHPRWRAPTRPELAATVDERTSHGRWGELPYKTIWTAHTILARAVCEHGRAFALLLRTNPAASLALDTQARTMVELAAQASWLMWPDVGGRARVARLHVLRRRTAIEHDRLGRHLGLDPDADNPATLAAIDTYAETLGLRYNRGPNGGWTGIEDQPNLGPTERVAWYMHQTGKTPKKAMYAYLSRRRSWGTVAPHSGLPCRRDAPGSTGAMGGPCVARRHRHRRDGRRRSDRLHRPLRLPAAGHEHRHRRTCGASTGVPADPAHEYPPSPEPGPHRPSATRWFLRRGDRHRRAEGCGGGSPTALAPGTGRQSISPASLWSGGSDGFDFECRALRASVHPTSKSDNQVSGDAVSGRPTSPRPAARGGGGRWAYALGVHSCPAGTTDGHADPAPPGQQATAGR